MTKSKNNSFRPTIEPLEDRVVLNNSMSTASWLGAISHTNRYDAFRGNVGYGNDFVDYVEFTVGDAATPKVKTNISLTGLSDDIDIEVLDSNGKRLRGSYKSGSRSESISLDLNRNSTYFVKVDPYRDASSSYRLTVEAPSLTRPLSVTHHASRSHVQTWGYAFLQGGKLLITVSGRNDTLWSTNGHRVAVQLLDANMQPIHSGYFYSHDVYTSGKYVPRHRRDASAERVHDLTNWDLSDVRGIRITVQQW